MKNWREKAIYWMEDVGRKIQKWEKIKKDNWVLEEDLESDNLVDQQSPHN